MTDETASGQADKPPNETLRPLPPSCKFVFATLKRDGPLTYDELHRKTTLPKPTLSDALHTLEDEDLIEPESVFAPLSKRKYQLV